MVYNCKDNDAMHDELFTRVKRLLTNRIHGKVARNSYKIHQVQHALPFLSRRVLVYNEQTNCLRV